MPLFVRYFLAIIGVALIITFISFLIWGKPRAVDAPLTASTPAEEKNPGVLATFDSGERWEGVRGSGNLEPKVLEYDAHNPDRLYLGTTGKGLWVYSREKDIFEQVQDSKNILRGDGDVYAIGQERSGKILYLAVYQENFGRLLKLNENIADELYIAPIKNYGIFGIAPDIYDSRILRAAVGDGSFIESTDGGSSKSWAVISRTRQSIMRLIMHPTVAGKYWGLGNKGELYSTESGGLLWEARSSISADKHTIKTVYDLAFSATRGSLLAATDYGFIESYDNGASWSLFTMPIPPGTIPITAVAAHPKFSEVLWIAAKDQLYRTDDGGITWIRIAVPTTRTISILKVHPTNSKILYAGLSK